MTDRPGQVCWRPRLRLRTLIGLVAVAAVGVWAGLLYLSPTRRYAGWLGLDQPAYVRAEGVGMLGEAPSWEAERAVASLIGALDDPNPMVRVYAASALSRQRERAAPAIPRLIRLLDDPLANVRFSTVGALGGAAQPGVAGRASALAALQRALADRDPMVRVHAASALAEAGEPDAGVGAIIDVMYGADEYAASWARHIDRQRGLGLAGKALADPDRIPEGLMARLRSPDPAARTKALAALTADASPSTVRRVLRSVRGTEDAEVRDWAEAELRRLVPDPEPSDD